MKEEIEKRRAEAAEKRQKVEDSVDGEDRPFKCVSPRGSSLKVSPSFLNAHLCLVSVQFYLSITCLLKQLVMITVLCLRLSILGQFSNSVPLLVGQL